jgi:hypothetical protein
MSFDWGVEEEVQAVFSDAVQATGATAGRVFSTVAFSSRLMAAGSKSSPRTTRTLFGASTPIFTRPRPHEITLMTMSLPI